MGTQGHRIIQGGNKVVALAITPEPLVAAAMPCVLIWVGAPHNDQGGAVNTAIVRLGPQGQEVMQLMPADAGGFYIPHSDAHLLYVDVAVNGESVDYAIFA